MSWPEVRSTGSEERVPSDWNESALCIAGASGVAAWVDSYRAELLAQACGYFGFGCLTHSGAFERIRTWNRPAIALELPGLFPKNALILRGGSPEGLAV
jgi:hypothetical protein